MDLIHLPHCYPEDCTLYYLLPWQPCAPAPLAVVSPSCFSHLLLEVDHMACWTNQSREWWEKQGVHNDRSSRIASRGASSEKQVLERWGRGAATVDRQAGRPLAHAPHGCAAVCDSCLVSVQTQSGAGLSCGGRFHVASMSATQVGRACLHRGAPAGRRGLLSPACPAPLSWQSC